MAGYVCTVAGGNGGVGKTTTAINLAAALAESGHEVAVVDADLGMPNVAEMLAVPVANSLHDVLAGRTTLSETLTEGPTGVTVVPGEPALEAYADADPPKLRSVVNTLRRAFDVVFVDTAAGLREENTVLLEMADGVLLVTVPDHVSLTDTTKTGQLAAMVDSEVVGALICRATDDTDLAAIDAQFDFPVLGGIPNDPEAAGAEPLVVEAPDSDAAAAFGAVGATLERVLVEGADAAALDPVD